jgi:hypothetical protein
MSREIMQQALDALRRIGEYGDIYRHKNTEQSPYTQIYEAIDAINVELAKPEQAKYSDIVSDGGLDPRNKFDAQPEQEPVGWFLKDHLETYMESYKDIEGAIPLYTSPPRKEWVGLTDKEIADFSNWLSCMNLVKAVEAKLKEKNGG